GSLLVADKGNNKAKLISTAMPNVGYARMDGSETPSGTSFNGPEGVAIDESGFLYIVDRLNQRVLRYDTYGNYVQDVNVEKNSDAARVLNGNKVGLTITTYGFIGTNFSSYAPSFEYPLGSQHMHMVRGGPWIGAISADENGPFIGVSIAAEDGSAGSNSAGEG